MRDLTAGKDSDELDDGEFRARFRQFLAAKYPAGLRQDFHRPFRRLRGNDSINWLRTLNQYGWRAPGWPQLYGGMGLSFRKQLIYHEELEFASVARIIDFGESQLGPTIIQLGSEAQKSYYLPRILSCEDVWCQGYSEPGAGSDLASLRTRGDPDGDDFIVNGQKIWTSHAHEATHAFLLVRTGKYPKKQQGISFLLVDLRTAGISIKPIINIAGEDEFCEVFFQDVRVPRRNLVGELDDGWIVAKALLGYERIFVGSPALASRALQLAHRLVLETGQSGDQGVMDRLAQLTADLHDFRLLYAQICDAVANHEKQPGPEVSMLKIYASELLQRITEFNVDIAGEYGATVGSQLVNRIATDLQWQFMMARPVSIFAGTNEIQRDIIAKSFLGLPAEKSH